MGIDVPALKPAMPRARMASPKTSPDPRVAEARQTPSAAIPPSHKKTAQETPPAPPQSFELAKSAKTLEELKNIMAHFDAGEISDHARQAVFSRGNPKAKIMVIGEAPGRDEDIAGKPFVGKSGQLLDKVFGAIGLSEEDIYITNVVNWRPPGNRNPTAAEITLCKPFLMRHIELIDPKLIVLVGGISMTAMTGLTGIMKNRGQWADLDINSKIIPMLPIYHPAFLLRQPAVKKDCWRDMLSLRARHAAL